MDLGLCSNITLLPKVGSSLHGIARKSRPPKASELYKSEPVDFSNTLFNLATVLVAGIVGGELVSRLRLPKVTGWIGTGILLRSLGLPGLEPQDLARYSPFSDAVLGYIAFTVGAALHFPSLRNAGKRLSLLLLGEATITPLIVIGSLLTFGGLDLTTSLLLSAIAIAGAPGTTVLVAQEARARGILTQTLIAAVALIDMVAVAVFAFVLSFLRGSEDGLTNWGHAFTDMGLEFAWAGAVGMGAAMLCIALSSSIVGPAFLGPLMVVVILGSWGSAQIVGVSSILACTFAGIALSNLRHESVRSAEAYLKNIGGVLFAGFFTLAGMRLDFGLVPPLIGLVILFFAARLIGKSLSAFTAMSLAKMPNTLRHYLGLALLPHGGVAVGLIFLVQENPALNEYADTITTVGLAALAINQLLGPSATRFAIGRAGEVSKDRPRLLDFLHEPHIITDFQASSKQDAFNQLVARLYSTTQDLPISQSEFMSQLIEREKSMSTCFGRGLMIPHLSMAEGDQVRGVLGLSAKGLVIDASDGKPVHAILLLATPATDRARHLEVLAAFATAITKDPNMRSQLYHARNPAHAYDVIHADDAVDMNYFLDEAIQLAMEDSSAEVPIENESSPRVPPLRAKNK